MADIFDVLADGTRRDILRRLLDREATVGDLVEQLGSSQPTVSKHLAQLREAELVTVREDGRRRIYALRPDPLGAVDAWLSPFLGGAATTRASSDGEDAGATIFAAWSMAFAPTKRTKDILMWMLSTKMMPAVGVLIPIYLIFRDLRLLDTLHGLTLIMTLINLPIIIWMLYTYFKEIPVDILEAARMDGAELWNEITHVLVPMAIPGIASTLLLNVILAWNEAFWTITLTSGRAGTLTAFISSFSSPQGLFLAKLSAASLLAIAPILLLGWFSQKQLVRGLTFGAVK